ncbi:sugar transport protein 7 isoform X1 [Cryptomeria japonica]|uniref:sugar transport protein 7 isoform X1 n=1 Tax=Cryptomeria japonica TaxID=3369 RepID=UPI0025AD08B0|nr:sugar transport protein 7 isoform X1 [Cryptomeria japonica]XP_057858872.1 sugar transport protein 7 isoform X1 [Cryptomeria japonica]
MARPKGKGICEERVDRYEGKTTVYVVLACMVASMGGVLFGYDFGVSGGVASMDHFLMKFFPNLYKRKYSHTETYGNNYCRYDNQNLGLFNSSLYVAGLFASLCASYVTRKYGRTNSIVLGGISCLLGVALEAGAINLSMLFTGRIIYGVGIGFGNQAIPVYISELAPANLRGGLNMMFEVAITFGFFTASMINYGTQKINHWGWRLSLGLGAVPALILTVGGILFLPETPNCLIEQGHVEKGRACLEKIRGTKNVQAEFEDMMDARELAKVIKNPYRNILKRTNRPQLVMAICMPAFHILTGIKTLLFYAPILFQSLGLGENSSLYCSVLTGILPLFAGLFSMATVDRWGRRALLLWGGIVMMICQATMGIILGLKYKADTLSNKLLELLVIISCIFVAAFGWSWGPLGWTVPSEIFPLETRSAGQAITVSVNLLSMFAITQSFLPLLCVFRYGIFLFFAGWICIMTVFVYLFLPETKGVPIEEMIFQWRKHWFWKKIVPPTETEEAKEKNEDPLEWIHNLIWEISSRYTAH